VPLKRALVQIFNIYQGMYYDNETFGLSAQSKVSVQKITLTRNQDGEQDPAVESQALINQA
jgi:hypothetical protein